MVAPKDKAHTLLKAQTLRKTPSKTINATNTKTRKYCLCFHALSLLLNFSEGSCKMLKTFFSECKNTRTEFIH